MQLKHLLETLEEYEPPIELLSRLNPSAPFRIHQSSSGWWKSNKARQDLEAFGDQGKELIKVLSGEEELSQLSSPKVRPSPSSSLFTLCNGKSWLAKSCGTEKRLTHRAY